MPIALESKIRGHEEAVIEHLELFGRGDLYRKWGCKSDTVWDKWCEKHTGNPRFGLSPKFPISLITDGNHNYNLAFDVAVSSVQEFVERLRGEITRLRQRNEFLEERLKLAVRDDLKKNVGRIMELRKICEP